MMVVYLHHYVFHHFRADAAKEEYFDFVTAFLLAPYCFLSLLLIDCLFFLFSFVVLAQKSLHQKALQEAIEFAQEPSDEQQSFTTRTCGFMPVQVDGRQPQDLC